MVSRKATVLYFRKERLHGTGNLKKYLFLGHLQPPLHKIQKTVRFDDVTVKNKRPMRTCGDAVTKRCIVSTELRFVFQEI